MRTQDQIFNDVTNILSQTNTEVAFSIRRALSDHIYEGYVNRWVKVEDRNIPEDTVVFFNTKKHGVLYGVYIVDNAKEEFCKATRGERKGNFYTMDAVTHIQVVETPEPPVSYETVQLYNKKSGRTVTMGCKSANVLAIKYPNEFIIVKDETI